MTQAEIERAKQVIGYEFNDVELLKAAFTHSSYVNEHSAVGNERLEFLGDCVLNFLVGVELYETLGAASEGAMSAQRAAMVSRAPLARLVDKYGLIDLLRVGAGVDKNAFSDKARSDLFEAIIGALYLDGGLDACRVFLKSKFFGVVEPERDYKTKLQEYATAHGLEAEYSVHDVGGEFECRVSIGDSVYIGRAKTKHSAQVTAAKAAVLDIEKCR